MPKWVCQDLSRAGTTSLLICEGKGEKKFSKLLDPKDTAVNLRNENHYS